MFVDACAIVSLIARDDDSEAYELALMASEAPLTSALAAWEAIIVLSRPDQLNCRYSQSERIVVEWLTTVGIALREADDPRQILRYAVQVAEEQGIGKRYLSNFDCFHYAYTKAANAGMITKDRLLKATDLVTSP
ncbi:ribonuclease VapC [Rhizobium aquaticum]|uniref:Ribonuclease VapC n=1 Tax=Rhizobium aquaticum TaxID=1549636 RepID=A0ABV2J2H9_9HYPH